MATAIFTTVVDRAVGDPLTEAIWDDQLKDNGNQLAGAHKSLMTNGGLEQWQRGAGPFTTATNYTADRWYISLISAGTVTVTKETTTVDASATGMKVVTTSGSVNNIIYNHTELLEGRGLVHSASLRVQQSVASGISMELATAGASSSAVTSVTAGAWVTLSTSLTTGASDAYIRLILRFPGAGTYYVDNAMLVLGPAPAPYRPLHPQEDLARCQRYCEVHGGVADEFPDIAGSATAGALSFRSSYPWAVAKGGVPTVTKNGTWAVLNCAQPTVTAATPSGYSIQCVSTAGGQYATNPNSTDDFIIGEWG